MQTETPEAAMNTPPVATEDKKKKKYRFKPGTVSLREIKKLQKTTKFLIQKKPFHRLVKSIAHDIKADCKFQQEAMKALQDDCESYLVQFFKRLQQNAIHAGRKTIHVNDSKINNEPLTVEVE